ncbi:hypothetical protein [uncultured Paraglaciecola sp.]|uniref:hypothetical protein n=1 Tax=uncultured Paraglaciecola sp. TaxID=1765024 RepID=UPI00261545A2|nr:hypothetical protein [uncultured Paraglaciecola sp.]
MDFSEFIESGKLRDHYIEIDGIGEIRLTELSGTEFSVRAKEAEALIDASIEENQQHMAWWAGRMLKGSNPTKPEVKKLLESYSPSVYVEIYQKGLAYNGGTHDAKERIEKK